MKEDALRLRVKYFLDDIGMSITSFREKVHISHATYYKWIRGELNLSEKTLEKIDSFVSEFSRNGKQY